MGGVSQRFPHDFQHIMVKLVNHMFLLVNEYVLKVRSVLMAGWWLSINLYINADLKNKVIMIRLHPKFAAYNEFSYQAFNGTMADLRVFFG